VPKLLADPVFA